MRNTIIGLVIVAIVGVGGYFAYIKLKPYAVQAIRVVDIFEKVLPLMEANTGAIDSLFRYLDDQEPFYDEFKGFVEKQTKHNQSIDEKLDKLPEHEIPEINYVHPDTYEDCMDELDKSRETSEQLLEIINTQKEEIALLRSINTSQALMIERYHEALEKKDLDINLLRGAYEGILAKARRDKVIGYGSIVLGVIIAIAL